MQRLTGWLFDVYAQGQGVSVWLIEESGCVHHLHDQLCPSFFVGGSIAELHRVCEWLVRARLPVRLQRAERYDIFAHQTRVVLQVQVLFPAHYPTIVHRIEQTFPALELYNADVGIAQFYFFERHLFPLAYCDVLVNDTRDIVEISTSDSRWAMEYRLPPLRCMLIQFEGGQHNPNHQGDLGHGHHAPLEIICEDQTYTIDPQDPCTLVERVREHLLQFDPDVILSRWGDAYILPQLLSQAQRYHIPLQFNRDLQRQPLRRPARSYFTYGRIMHKTASHTLFGRWHIDLENATLFDYGLEGAIELARLTQQPLQQTVRVSTGTGISAMEVATAYQKDYLIPYRKTEPEEFKTARELLTADKGGLTYQPIAGLHFNVAELDFASMYPAIMARFNVSPETLHCHCCPTSHVPEIGYTICRRERGVVPETLAPLIEKRLAYKRRLKQTTEQTEKEYYRRRVSAHKWLLVTCFGYLGYKNARFGKIEAHEAVTAYGREMLLRAKDLVEERGFRVLHMLTDSLWIQKASTGDAEYVQLTREIEQATNLPIELEGLYHWVAFLPSRVNPYASVPNRYFGAMRDGELKVRGIEMRRGDTPEFIKNMQRDLLNTMAKARTRTELAAILPNLLAIITTHIEHLRTRQVPIQDLAFTYRLSRQPEAYVTNTLNAIVARDLARRGVRLAAGESVRYIITDDQAQVPSERARSVEFLDGDTQYDVARYANLLLRAAETLLTPLGVNGRMLAHWKAKALPTESLQWRVQQNQSPAYLGPLFEKGLGRADGSSDRHEPTDLPSTLHSNQ